MTLLKWSWVTHVPSLLKVSSLTRVTSVKSMLTISQSVSYSVNNITSRASCDAKKVFRVLMLPNWSCHFLILFRLLHPQSCHPCLLLVLTNVCQHCLMQDIKDCLFVCFLLVSLSTCITMADRIVYQLGSHFQTRGSQGAQYGAHTTFVYKLHTPVD